MKIRPEGAEMFHVDRQTHRRIVRHNETNRRVSAILLTRLKNLGEEKNPQCPIHFVSLV